MPYDQLARWLAGGAAAAAALCTGPQAAACAALAGAALLAAGSATVLYAALVNSNWDAYRAYERVIAEANAGLHPYPPEITATPGAPAQPGYYPGERLNEDPFAGTVIYRATQLARTSTPEPEPDPTPSPARIPIPYDTCTSTPRPKRCDPQRVAQWKSTFRTRVVNPSSPWSWERYQYWTAGPLIYQVDYNGVSIAADGIRDSDCSFVDAKYAGTNQSFYVPGSTGNPELEQRIQAKTRAQFKDQYGRLIDDPTSPMVRLEVVTNRPESQLLFQTLLAGVPGSVILNTLVP
jgi:hypothetical protein